jgi:hypothetical protein
MNSETLTTNGATTDRISAAIVGVALIMSAMVARGLISADLSAMRRLQQARQAAADSPAPAVLIGHRVRENREWAAQVADGRQVVLFAVAGDGETDDARYWADVALQARATLPDVQFVGVCMTNRNCAVPSAATETLTMLSAMDPSQMRALAIASRDGRVLVYDGRGHRQMLPVQINQRALIAAIARALPRESKEGGV